MTPGASFPRSAQLGHRQYTGQEIQEVKGQAQIPFWNVQDQNQGQKSDGDNVDTEVDSGR